MSPYMCSGGHLSALMTTDALLLCHKRLGLQTEHTGFLAHWLHLHLTNAVWVLESRSQCICLLVCFEWHLLFYLYLLPDSRSRHTPSFTTKEGTPPQL